MTQTLLAYGATAVAAVWVVWSVILPRSLKQRLRGGAKTKSAKACGDDCGCGD